LCPTTVIVWTSPAVNGVDRGPMVSGAARVSITRQGAIEMKIGFSPLFVTAVAVISPPAPSVTAAAAPIALHRVRENGFTASTTTPFGRTGDVNPPAGAGCGW